MSTEAQLIQRILSGDYRAFEELITQYERLIRHIIGGLVKQDADIDDLVQDILVKVYQRLPSFRHQSKLSTWIGKITYNHCLNYLRRERRKPSFNDFPDFEENVLADNNYEEKPNQQDAHAILHQAIEKLPEPYRLTLNLFHLENMNYDEISEILDIPQGTIKSRLFRARKVLKEILTNKLP